MTEPPRPLSVRKQDALRRLDEDIDLWVATASTDGTPYLMPLSFLWNGTTLLLSTAAGNPTAKNLQTNATTQLTLGHTRDVVHITAVTTEVLPAEALAGSEGDAFASKTGFDPRSIKSPYLYFRLTPTKIQAWREVNELATRTLMHNGTWLA